MATKTNFMVKVVDAKMTDIKKALETAGIKVNSIIEMYKEEAKEVEAIKGHEQG